MVAVMLLITDNGRMFTYTLFVSEQPVAVIVSVKVYRELVEVVAVGFAAVELDKPEEGLQL